MAPTKRRTNEERADHRTHASQLLADGVPPSLVVRTLQLTYNLSRSTAYEDVVAAEQHREPNDPDLDHAPDILTMRKVFLNQLESHILVASAKGEIKDMTKLLTQWKSLASMGGHARLED